VTDGAVSGIAGGPDPTVEQLNDVPHDRQTEKVVHDLCHPFDGATERRQTLVQVKRDRMVGRSI